MKKVCSFLLAVVMVFSLLPGVARAEDDNTVQKVTDFLGIVGSPDPSATIVMTAEELAAMKEGSFVLGADIDLSTYNNGTWEPIEISGDIVFDGQGHTLSNCSDSLFEENGSFSEHYSMEIKNLGMMNTNGALIYNWTNSGDGSLELTIENCYVTGASLYGLFVGEIDSYSYTSSFGFDSYYAFSTVTISDCYAEGTARDGGFIGSCSSRSDSNSSNPGNLSVIISDSISNANISAYEYSGGFVGNLNYYNAERSLSFVDCQFIGTIDAVGDNSVAVGGMVGKTYSFPISFDNCIVNGKLKLSEGGGYIGAFVGNGASSYTSPWQIYKFISKCYYYGEYPIANHGGQYDEAYILNPENAIKLNGGEDIPDIETTFSAVQFFSQWKAETHQAFFNNSTLAYNVTDETDLSAAGSIEQLVGKYVLVETDQDQIFNITSIKPVDSKIGEVKNVIVEGGDSAVTSLQFDDGTYAVAGALVAPDTLIGKRLLYHLYNGEIVGFETLEKRTGVLESWNEVTGQVTVGGQDYLTNYMTDKSLFETISQYEGEQVDFYVGRDAIFLFELVAASEEFFIKVYADSPSLTTNVGGGFDMICTLYRGDQVVEDWAKPAFVIGNGDVISISDYERKDSGYHFAVEGLSEGRSSLTISDSSSGAYISFDIVVDKAPTHAYTYHMDQIPSFLPNAYGETALTNFYNINQLYVNNFSYQLDNDGDYLVSFDVYNESYMYGAVDVYSIDGTWIASEKIGKFSEISSIYDTGEAIYYLVADSMSAKILSYTSGIISEKTSISIEVPKDGYFVISNNYAESPGAYLYNSLDFVMLAMSASLNVATSDGKNKTVMDAATDMLFMDNASYFEKYGTELTETQLQKIFLGQFKSIASKSLQSASELGIGEMLGAITSDGEALLKSAGLDWKSLYKNATGVWESAFEKVTGPIGAAMKGLFSFTKYSSYGVQVINVCASSHAPCIIIYAPANTSSGTTMQGVTVTPSEGAVDSEAVLQVFRVANNDSITVVLDGEYHYEDYELYNICFVKDGHEVQPNGKVTVRIPIPDGYPKDNCTVMRQNIDGSWTVLFAKVDGNYLVFETNHFSLYAVVDMSDAPLYVVQFSTGQGSVVSPQTVSFGNNAKKPTDPACEGYTFGGWFKDTACTLAWDFETDVVTGNITLYAKWNKANPGGNSGSGNSDEGNGNTGGVGGNPSIPNYPSSYQITLPSDSKNGTVTANHKTASVGTRVTLTVTPDKGYVVDQVIVKDSGGKAIKTTDNGDGTYTFVMPSGGVMVTVTFKADKCDGGESCPSKKFSDVDQTAWYHGAVDYVVEHGLMNGTGDITFAPDSTTTRAMLVTILYRMEGEPGVTASDFIDVKAGQWYTDAVAWAAANKIVEGYGNGTFGPEDPITREQMAVILYRYADYKGYDVTDSDDLSDFTDAGNISSWAAASMRWAVAEDLIEGTSTTTLTPTDESTRAQVATILMRFCDKIQK